VPFALGAALAVLMFKWGTLDVAQHRGRVLPTALFMGAAMSVTAFPVLARILTERDLLRTRVGAVALACAAVDDVTAWCILAGVVALIRAGHAGLPWWGTVLGSAAFVAAMIWIARPLLARLERRFERDGRVTQDVLAAVFLVTLASAWTTEALGIHALFGAFLAGAVMPKGEGFVHALAGKLEDVTVVLLLPLFFAFTGLRTRIGLVDGAEMWGWCGLIVLVAVAGKLGGGALAARMTGMRWREAGAIGTLMNTRGLMELVILNLGLDIGVISPAVFAMMVLMALATTFMTSPLLELVYPPRLIRRTAMGEDGDEHEAGEAIELIV